MFKLANIIEDNDKSQRGGEEGDLKGNSVNRK